MKKKYIYRCISCGLSTGSAFKPGKRKYSCKRCRGIATDIKQRSLFAKLPGNSFNMPKAGTENGRIKVEFGD